MMALLHSCDLKMHYHATGDGPAWILIHGLASNLASWYPEVVRGLNNDFRVITYDLRGHGRSEMPVSGYTTTDLAGDLLALMNHLGLQSAHIAGHSFGGGVALQFASLYPERVTGLALADAVVPSLQSLSVGDHAFWECWQERIEELGAAVPAGAPRVTYALFEELARMGDGGNVSSGGAYLSSQFLGPRSRAQWQALLKDTTALADFADKTHPSAAEIVGIALPVLLIYGEQSPYLATCDHLYALLPHATRVVLGGAGHLHPMLRPHQLIAHLRTFAGGYQ